MYMEYRTNRLILKILTSSYYKDVLEFQKRNRDSFEKYEPTRPLGFYTAPYQQNILKCEYKMAQKLLNVRFYAFLHNDPCTIIGTVCLHNVMRAPYECCELGYKFDCSYRHQGYAREAVSKILCVAFYDLKLHRAYARVSPDNAPSIRLLEALGFTNEGIERGAISIHGEWTDHIRYGLVRPD